MNSKIANITKLLSANVIAQAIGVLIYPILTRMYEPADFTLFNLFLTIANAILIIATLDLQYAIPMPAKEEGAFALCGSIVVPIAITMAITLIICMFYDSIASFFGIVDLGWALWYLPLYVCVMACSQIILYLYNREKKYGEIAKFQVVQSFTNSALKLLFGILPCGGLALVDATVIGPIIAFTSLFSKKVLYIIDNFRTVHTDDAWSYVKKYKDFPLYSMPKNLICHLSNGLPVLILTPVFGATEVGYFALAITIGYLPLSMIASSIYQVMLRSTSEKLNEGKPIFPEVHQFCVYSSQILFLAFCLAYFFLPNITEALFGSGWARTGEILRILLPWFATNFLAASLVFLPETLLKLKGNLIIEVIFIGMRILALIYGINYLDFFTTLKLFSVISFSIKVFQASWFLWIAKQHDKGLVKKVVES